MHGRKIKPNHKKPVNFHVLFTDFKSWCLKKYCLISRSIHSIKIEAFLICLVKTKKPNIRKNIKKT